MRQLDCRTEREREKESVCVRERERERERGRERDPTIITDVRPESVSLSESEISSKRRKKFVEKPTCS